MLLTPIIQRELRVALRKFNPVKARFQITLGSAGIVALFLFLSLAFGGVSSWQSYELLFVLGMSLAIGRTAQISAGLFSDERRNQTLELLFLTGLSARELFASKLIGGLLIASTELMALLPFLAIPFLSGGLSLDLFVATLVCLPTLLLFSFSVSTFASVACRDDGEAMLLATIIVVALSGAAPAPYLLGIALTGAPPFSSGWLWSSPGYAPWLIWNGFGKVFAVDFWPALSVTLVWTLIGFCLASVTLSRHWQSLPVGQTGRWAAWRRFWERGAPRFQAALRRVVLEENAFRWLVERDRRPVRLAWSWVGCVAILWLLGWAAWPRAWPSTMNFFLTALALILPIGGLESYAAARRIGEDRRDGMLESLLTTSLTPADIIAGQVAATQAQLRGPKIVISCVCMALMVAGFFIRPWNPTALAVYLVIWSLIFWWNLCDHRYRVQLAMWIALNTGRPSFAVFRSSRHPATWL